MLKRLLFFCLLMSISINLNYVIAETVLIIPIKKPTLTDKEIKEKISKNILKPIKKPKEAKNIEVKETKIAEIKEVKKDKNLLSFEDFGFCSWCLDQGYVPFDKEQYGDNGHHCPDAHQAFANYLLENYL